MDRINLDKIAAEKAQEILAVRNKKVGKNLKNVDIKTLENLATKVLGVIQEQGIYAGILFLFSRSGATNKKEKLDSEKIICCYIATTLLNVLLHDSFKPWNFALTPTLLKWSDINIDGKKLNLLNELAKENKLLDDIDKLFLMKSLYEQILIYTRFSAKAAKIEAENKSNTDSTDLHG